MCVLVDFYFVLYVCGGVAVVMCKINIRLYVVGDELLRSFFCSLGIVLSTDTHQWGVYYRLNNNLTILFSLTLLVGWAY